MNVSEILKEVARLQREEEVSYQQWKKFAHRDDIPKTIEQLYDQHKDAVKKLHEFMDKNFVEG